MAKSLTTIGFDADDTLWQNEQFLRLTQDRFVTLLDQERKLTHTGFRSLPHLAQLPHLIATL